MKVYVVTQTGYEYNDEYYREPEDTSSGVPVVAYKTRSAAEKALEKKTAEWVSRTDIFDYGYGSNVIKSMYEFSMILGKEVEEIPDAPDAIVAATDKKEAKWLHNHLKK